MPDSRAGFDVRHFVINSAFSFGFRHSEMIVRSCGATTCNPLRASLYESLAFERVGTEVAKRGRL